MERDASLLVDVTVALCLALAGGWIATRLRLPALIGYIAAGVLISPFTPGFVGDLERLRLVADIGIVLLLFAIGVQFSLSELARIGPRIVVAAVVMSAIVFAAVAVLSAAAGASRDASLYIAAAVVISSSVVIVKLLDMRGETSSEHGRATIAVSIVQDLIAVVLIVVLSSISEGGGDNGSVVRDTALAGVKAAAFVALLLFVGLRVIPLVLSQVAEERSRELFFVAIAVLVIGTALASEWAGLSIALGAFLAGIVVSESDLSHRVLGELLPTRDVFAVLFFVSAGMLVDPAVVRDEWPAILGITAAIVLLKPLIFATIVRPAVHTAATALLTTALLMPVGEFSFLLAADGLDNEALSDDQFGVILTSAVISIAAAPVALAGADIWIRRRESRGGMAPEPGTGPSRLGRRAVVVGYGRTGQTVAGVLHARFDVLIIEESAQLARQAREAGLDVLEGSPTSREVVARMDLGDARILIVSIADPFTARLLSEHARAANPHLEIVAHASARADMERLRKSGVSDAVVAEDEVALELARYGLHRFGVSSAEALRIIQRARAETRRQPGI